MMTISSLTGVPDECQLLDTACIYDGQALNCIAYAQSCSVKFTKVGQTFATFLLKDKNANVITARLFNLSEESAKISQTFARKPVQIHGEVQVFNGTYSIILDGNSGVSLYSGDFDYMSFLGSYKVDLSAAATIYEKVIGSKLPEESYKNFTIDFLGNGRVGAFAKLFDMALSNLLFLENLPGVDLHDLLQCYFIAMQQYYIILVKFAKLGPLGKITLLDTYNDVHCDDNIRYLVLDTLRSICENSKPLHVYAHIIYDALMQANRTMQLLEANTLLVDGADTSVYFTDLLGNNISGGVELLKY